MLTCDAVCWLVWGVNESCTEYKRIMQMFGYIGKSICRTDINCHLDERIMISLCEVEIKMM